MDIFIYMYVYFHLYAFFRLQFLFVSRRAMSFAGDSHWVYTCSCDVAVTELIECCGQQMEVTFAG